MTAPREVEVGERPPAVSFDALFTQHLEFVVRSLLRLGVVSRDVEDAAQQVWIVAYQRFGNFTGERPRTWLWAIARRVASDYRALAHYRIELDAGVSADARQSDTNLMESMSARELVHRALQEIPDERREVLILYEMEGLTLAELSEMAEAPLPTIASRLKKARLEFANAVEKLQGGAR